MSYCRWSSLNFQCDLYVYDDVCGGVTIHVAAGRRVFPDDFPPDPSAEFLSGTFPKEEYPDRYRAWANAMDKCEIKEIGLPFDGKSFLSLDYEDAAGKVSELRALGYIAPDGVEELILEEWRDREQNEPKP